MLDSYIIEELKRVERERERDRLQRERQRPSVEIPVQREDLPERDRRSDGEDAPGGSVVQVDISLL